MNNIYPPTTCPSCNYKLEFCGDLLYCRNSACSAQLLKKLEHFTKTLGIKGLGPKTIEKLQLQDITELFYLDEEEVQKVLGEKIATKLLNEIEKAKTASLSTVLESFSIPLIGNTAAKKLCTVISSIEEISHETCKQAGLGDKATQNLLNWIDTEYNEIQEFLPFDFSKQTVVKNTGNRKTVCITGKLRSFNKKAEAAAVLEAAGYTVVDSVTKQLDYLIDETDVISSKREKAMQYGITIITNINDFIKGI